MTVSHLSLYFSDIQIISGIYPPSMTSYEKHCPPVSSPSVSSASKRLFRNRLRTYCREELINEVLNRNHKQTRITLVWFMDMDRVHGVAPHAGKAPPSTRLNINNST